MPDGESYKNQETLNLIYDALLKEKCERTVTLIALGGGAILSEENRALLKERGKVIYLNAKPQHLAKRMAYDKDRPLLQQGNMLETLNQLYKDRHPLYLNVASFVVDTGQQKTQTIINKIESLLS